MILKEIGRKIAQAFRLVKTADKKVASSVVAMLDAKAYEKSFGPEPPEPDSLMKANESLVAATYELWRFAEAPRPEPLSHLANNWRKMHGLPMHRKSASFRRRRKSGGTGKQSK